MPRPRVLVMAVLDPRTEERTLERGPALLGACPRLLRHLLVLLGRHRRRRLPPFDLLGGGHGFCHEEAREACDGSHTGSLLRISMTCASVSVPAWNTPMT